MTLVIKQIIVEKHSAPQTSIPDPSKDDDPLVKMIYADLVGDKTEDLIKLRLPNKGDKLVGFTVYDMQTYLGKWGESISANSSAEVDHGYFVRINKSGQKQNEILEYEFIVGRGNEKSVTVIFRTFTLALFGESVSVNVIDEAAVEIVFDSAENENMNRERFTDALERLKKNLESNDSYDVYTIVRWDGEKLQYSEKDSMLVAENIEHTFDSLKELMNRKAQ